MITQDGEHGRATQLRDTGQPPSEVVAYPALGSLPARSVGTRTTTGRVHHDFPDGVAPPVGYGISDNANARANLSIDYLKPEKMKKSPLNR